MDGLVEPQPVVMKLRKGRLVLYTGLRKFCTSLYLFFGSELSAFWWFWVEPVVQRDGILCTLACLNSTR